MIRAHLPKHLVIFILGLCIEITVAPAGRARSAKRSLPPMKTVVHQAI